MGADRPELQEMRHVNVTRRTVQKIASDPSDDAPGPMGMETFPRADAGRAVCRARGARGGLRRRAGLRVPGRRRARCVRLASSRLGRTGSPPAVGGYTSLDIPG